MIKKYNAVYFVIFFSSVVIAQETPSPKNFEDAGMCWGANMGHFSKGGKVSDLSEVAQANVRRIYKEIVPRVDHWAAQRDKCWGLGGRISEIQRCIEETVPDTNAALFHKSLVLAAEFMGRKDTGDRVVFTNSTCVGAHPLTNFPPPPQTSGQQKALPQDKAVRAPVGKINITLKTSKSVGKQTCQLFYEIVNKTSFNITSITFNTTFRGAGDAILGKNYLRSNRVALNGPTEIEHYAMDISCSDIKSIKLNPIFLLFIDGDSRRDLMDSLDGAIETSSGLQIKLLK